MCGICGLALADPNRKAEPEILHGMTSVMIHRGPDDEGFFWGQGIGLGMRRLSIIDLETGQQPLFSEDQEVALVCNGEIYNYRELRQELLRRGHVLRSHSDAEVVIHLYEELGPECVSRLRGMFAFALWDGARRRLMLARDRLGIKPLHYALASDGDLLFASEQKALLASGRISAELSPSALRDLFTFGFLVPPRCTMDPVKQLLPGSYLLFQEGHLETHVYWDLEFPQHPHEDPGRSADQWASELEAKLQECVRIHLRSDVDVGAWLSPGIDSSGVVSLMAAEAEAPVETFSVGFEGSPEADETVRYPTLDRFSGWNLSGNPVSCGTDAFGRLPEALWYRESPISSAVFLPQLLLAEETRKKVKVVLTGEGADEILGGYPWYLADRAVRPFCRLPLGLRGFMMDLLLVDRWRPWIRQAFTAPAGPDFHRYRHLLSIFPKGIPEGLFRRELTARMEALDPQDAPLRAPDGFGTWHPFARMQYLETKIRLVGFIVWGLDRMSMARSVEARVPFLDHELVELCSRVPVSLKMRGLKEKYILRRALAKHLPPEILKRRKRGLTAPNREWFRGPLPGYVRALLSGRAVREKGYFQPAFVGRVLARHREGRGNHDRLLMMILGVQLWDELFRQGTPYPDLGP